MSSTTQVKRAHPHIKHTATEKKVHVRTEAGDSLGWISRPSPLVALHKRLSKGFRWIFGLKEKKSAESEGSRSRAEQTSTKSRSVPESPRQTESQKSEGGSSREEQTSTRNGPESAPETKFKQRNLISTSSSSSLTQSGGGREEKSEEVSSASKSNPQPAKKESPANAPQADQRRTVDLSRGSPDEKTVSPLLAKAVASGLKQLESKGHNGIDGTIVADMRVGFDDYDLELPSNLRLVTHGMLDGFVRELGTKLSPGTPFDPQVEWKYSVDVKSREVTATYRLYHQDVLNDVPILEGQIAFEAYGDGWHLAGLDLLGPAVPQGLTKAKDDPMESDTLVSSSRSSEEESDGHIEYAVEVEYVADSDGAKDAEDDGKTTTSSSDDDVAPALSAKILSAVVRDSKFTPAKPKDTSTSPDKASRPPLSALQSEAADHSASESIDEPVPLKKPKSLKKNLLTAAIRGKAWDLKETVGHSVKETASDIRAGVWDGKENVKDSVIQATKTIAENLKSEVQREAESLYGKNPDATQLKAASDRISARAKKYNGVLRACIPEMGDLSVLIGSGPKPFLEYVSGPLALKAVQNQFEKGISERYRTKILVGPYAQGVLDCHKAFDDRQFAKNKVNWLPKDMQEAYKAAGSPQNVTKWLENLIEIRKLLNSINRDRAQGIQLGFQADEYNKLCKEAGVDSELIEDEKIVFRNALSYATGWKAALDEADRKNLMI